VDALATGSQTPLVFDRKPLVSGAPGVEYQQWHAAVRAVRSIAHKRQIAGAKPLAASIIDLMTSPDLIQKAGAEFEVESKHALFLVASGRGRARQGDEPRRDGEMPPAAPQILFEHVTALQLRSGPLPRFG
jgi:hypothetical protein